MSFFTLRTHHGTTVRLSATTGYVAGFDEGANDALTLIAYLPPSRPSVCFLFSAGLTEIRFTPDRKSMGTVALGATNVASGVLSLYDPLTRLWLCAVPEDASRPNPEAPIVIGSPLIAAFERFELLPVQAIFVPPEIVDAAGRLNVILSGPLGVDTLRKAEPRDAPLIEAVAQTMTSPAFEAFAQSLVSTPEAADAMARVFGTDLIATSALPGLARWLAARDGMAFPPVRERSGRSLWPFSRSKQPQVTESAPPPTVLPIGTDSLATTGFDGGFVSLPYACNARVRYRVSPRRDLCIIATARNEGVYLLEWVAYHRALGVQAIFLYTNNCDDGSDLLLAALHEAGVIRWTRSEIGPGGQAQPKAYAHALSVRPDVLDYRWALIIDIDEYLGLNPNVFNTAIDFADWHDTTNTDAVALNWVLHGSAAQGKWGTEFIGRRFAGTHDGAGAHIKAMCRPAAFIHSGPHVPRTFRNRTFSFKAADGRMHVPSGDPSLSAHPTAEIAWISHFFWKSTEEFLWKWSRNRGDHALTTQPTNTALTLNFVHSYMEQFRRPADSIVDLFASAPSFAEEYANLAALPGVSAATDRIKALFKDRIGQVVELFSTAPAILDAGEIGQALLATLGRN